VEVKTMQTATQTVSARTGAIRNHGGHSLAARAVNALYAGDYRFDKQMGGVGFEAWSCTGGEVPYIVQVQVRSGEGVNEKVIDRCDCPDSLYRARTCKHCLLLSVATGYALRVGESILRFASELAVSSAAMAEAAAKRAHLVETEAQRQAQDRIGIPRDGGVCPKCQAGRLEAGYESGPSISGMWLDCPECYAVFRAESVAASLAREWAAKGAAA
jgi:hypothetical protein